MGIPVECYAGYKAGQRPARFTLGEREYRVEEVVDQWYSPEAAWFRVRAEEGNLYVLRHSGCVSHHCCGRGRELRRWVRRSASAGNVRELDHAVERSVLMAQGGTVKASDLALRAGREGAPRLEEMSLEEVESFLIRKALARYQGNVSQAAGALGGSPESW